MVMSSIGDDILIDKVDILMDRGCESLILIPLVVVMEEWLDLDQVQLERYKLNSKE